MRLLDRDLVESWADAYLDVRSRSGEEWSCVCPFHQDSGTTKPDLYLNVRKGVYLCMSTSCGARGSVVELVARVSGVEQADAERVLGLGGKRRVEAVRERLAVARQPAPEEPRISRARLEELRSDRYWSDRRGLAPETCERFELGFDDLTRRAVIPYRDREGVCRYLIQRATGGGDGPRYLYPRGFPLRSALFNLYAIDARDEVILVEGSVDAMKVWQAGVTNVVALLGSGAFDEQLAQLRNLRLVAFLDRDAAGAAAVRRLCKHHSRVFRVARYPATSSAKDPDGLTADEVRRAVERAVPSTTWARSGAAPGIVRRVTTKP